MSPPYRSLLFLLALTGVVCPGYHLATACADQSGRVLGEVACAAAMTNSAITATAALLEVSKASAGEAIDACRKKFGATSVHQVGRRITGSAVEFAPYTVVDGSTRTRLADPAALEKYKKPPPPPPPPKIVRGHGETLTAKTNAAFIALLFVGILFV